jgi:hypothetical protein
MLCNVEQGKSRKYGRLPLRVSDLTSPVAITPSKELYPPGAEHGQ